MKGLSLGRAFRQIGSLTAVSRIMGFMRDIAFAAFLGAGGAADAFLVALKLPNMFRRLSAEGAIGLISMWLCGLYVRTSRNADSFKHGQVPVRVGGNNPQG